MQNCESDQEGNPRLIRQKFNHAIINQLLDLTMKEIEPLKLEIVKEESTSSPVNREEVARKVVSLLTGWMNSKSCNFRKKGAKQRGEGDDDSGTRGGARGQEMNVNHQ